MLAGYQNLIVWQKSMELVKEIYSIIKLLPNSERFILIHQILRAAISIPSNIAEGYGRNGNSEYKRFLTISRASACELETQLIICSNEYSKIDYTKANQLTIEIKKMLYSLIKNLGES